MLGRALIGSLFVYGGRNAIKDRGHLMPIVDGAQEKYGAKKQAPASSEQLIQANGAGMIALSATLALGIKPRLSALGRLGATTAAAHDFWNIEDPQARNQQMTAFFGNIGAAGGLITIASTSN